MRHPAAPTIIAILFGFLAFMILWSRVRSDGHHEGNPHPDDVPRKKGKDQERILTSRDGDDTAEEHRQL
ncbi:hypothetical protein EJ02DRAFT_114066 [Clathrospora elynae]|uniref:Uncharacterized protein n=1 Tax=Clathrospora elynae TaxID=706981 RepID=A0A6A5STP2_9PLEO|nr:hypothetical protein EJ02DRAFT_114066 [Clathrospora elynae]